MALCTPSHRFALLPLEFQSPERYDKIDERINGGLVTERRPLAQLGMCSAKSTELAWEVKPKARE